MRRPIRPASAPSPAATAADYGQDPVRTATLAYDAVALVAALVKTQGAQRFSPEVLTNPSGFAGIDGLFRFRADGTNQRGLAVMKVAPSGGQPVAGSPKSFGRSMPRHSGARTTARTRKRDPAQRKLDRVRELARDREWLVTPRDPRPRRRAPESRPASPAAGRRRSTSIAPSSRRIAMRAGSSARPASAA